MINLPKNIKTLIYGIFSYEHYFVVYNETTKENSVIRFENLISLGGPLLFSSKEGKAIICNAIEIVAGTGTFILWISCLFSCITWILLYPRQSFSINKTILRNSRTVISLFVVNKSLMKKMLIQLEVKIHFFLNLWGTERVSI